MAGVFVRHQSLSRLIACLIAKTRLGPRRTRGRAARAFFFSFVRGRRHWLLAGTSGFSSPCVYGHMVLRLKTASVQFAESVKMLNQSEVFNPALPIASEVGFSGSQQSRESVCRRCGSRNSACPKGYRATAFVQDVRLLWSLSVRFD